MSEDHHESPSPETEVYQTPRFEKQLKKLASRDQELVEDAIDEIIDNPEVGELKTGDLSYLRVYKFDVQRTQYLLGYNWDEDRIVIHLLQLGTHENYYKNARTRRKADIKYIAPKDT